MATAPIRPLAWEPPCAVGAAQEIAKRQQQQQKKNQKQKTKQNKQKKKTQMLKMRKLSFSLTFCE